MKNLIYLKRGSGKKCFIDEHYTELKISSKSLSKLLSTHNIEIKNSRFVDYDTQELLNLGLVYSGIPESTTVVNFRDHLVIETYKTISNFFSFEDYVEPDNFSIKDELTLYSEKKCLSNNCVDYFFLEKGKFFIYTPTKTSDKLGYEDKLATYINELDVAIGIESSIAHPVDLHLGNVYVSEFVNKNSFAFSIFSRKIVGYPSVLDQIPLEHLVVFIWKTKKRLIVEEILMRRELNSGEIESLNLPSEIKKSVLDKITRRKMRRI